MSKILMGLVIICLIASMIYKKWAVTSILRELYRLQAAEDSVPFMKVLDSDFARFHYSEFTRTFMKLNYWIGREAYGEADGLIPAFESMKCSPGEQTALYSKLLGYALEQGRYDAAQSYLRKLEQLLKGRTDRKSYAVLHEIGQLERVYLKRDTSIIPELEAALAAADGEAEAVICYRLAKLYCAKGEHDLVSEYLRRALGCTVSGPAKRKLEQAMGDRSILT